MRKPPEFWARPEGAKHPAARLLKPFGKIYGAIVQKKLKNTVSLRVQVPVICVGNITMGGVGKTPFADLLCTRLSALGKRPFILMRGYGGSEPGPVRVRDHHTAAEVGDEAKMQADKWPVVISKDRAMGAVSAIEQGADIIVMDDGFQNPALHKDLSFVLIDGETGLGNGQVFPAGPLRENPQKGLSRASAIVIVGDGNGVDEAFSPDDAVVLFADITSDVSAIASGSTMFAFAGIGRPEKFFASLEAQNMSIVGKRSFPDHHPYTDEDIQGLRRDANGAQIVTTEKDLARLTPSQREGILAVPATMTIRNSEVLDSLLQPFCAKLQSL